MNEESGENRKEGNQGIAGINKEGIGPLSEEFLILLGAMTFFVFFPAPARAGIIATNLLLTSLNGSMLGSGSRLTPAVQI